MKTNQHFLIRKCNLVTIPFVYPCNGSILFHSESIISYAELSDKHNMLPLFVPLKMTKFPYCEFFKRRICNIISIAIVKLNKDMQDKFLLLALYCTISLFNSISNRNNLTLYISSPVKIYSRGIKPFLVVQKIVYRAHLATLIACDTTIIYDFIIFSYNSYRSINAVILFHFESI